MIVAATNIIALRTDWSPRGIEQELLIQLRHYSPASKREALLGLKSIVDRHPRFAEVNFARLAEGSLELSVCFDNDVRK